METRGGANQSGLPLHIFTLRQLHLSLSSMAAKKGGVQQVLADHFAKVYKVALSGAA